jgi:chemotaxis receptor (MCP) glutamine deamidase CheD
VDAAGETALGGCLAAIAPADKKKIHGMRDAILVPCRR